MWLLIHVLIRRSGQVRSGHVRLFNVHIQSTVVAHACYGHRYWPSPVPLTGTGISPQTTKSFMYSP